MAIKAETTFFLKDQLFNAHTVAELSSALAKARPQVNQRKFEQDILSKALNSIRRWMWLPCVCTL
jgi:hypothetical protein